MIKIPLVESFSIDIKFCLRKEGKKDGACMESPLPGQCLSARSAWMASVHVCVQSVHRLCVIDHDGLDYMNGVFSIYICRLSNH